MSHHNRTTIAVYPADVFRVSDGVAEGEELSFFEDLMLDDVYRLDPSAKRSALSYELGDGPAFVLAQDTQIGTPGNLIYLDCTITMMAPDGATIEALVLVEVEGEDAADVYLMPLATLHDAQDYRLVGADRGTVAAKFGDVACTRFARGTHITRDTGEQVAIEDLRAGDVVLTRDSGPKPIRWIGQTTVRAQGDFAPVVVTAGTLFNTRDLTLSADHRLFIYQREDELGVGRAQVLVKVRHLINGDTVYRQSGGYVDYFQILFDDHQIIYAEGIAAETLLVNARTRAALPDGVAMEDHIEAPHLAFEITQNLANRPDVVALLKRASSS